MSSRFDDVRFAMTQQGATRVPPKPDSVQGAVTTSRLHPLVSAKLPVFLGGGSAWRPALSLSYVEDLLHKILLIAFEQAQLFAQDIRAFQNGPVNYYSPHDSRLHPNAYQLQLLGT